jgi:hypothetical protein
MRGQLHDLAQNAQLNLGVKHIFARPAVPFAAEHERIAASPASHVVGLFQDLVTLRHPHLCEYVELVKGRHGTSISPFSPSIFLSSLSSVLSLTNFQIECILLANTTQAISGRKLRSYLLRKGASPCSLSLSLFSFSFSYLFLFLYNKFTLLINL